MKKNTKVKVARKGSEVDLRGHLVRSRYPLLCLGPMSKNIVDAIIEYGNAIKQPLPLIATRRQIECEELGGGYVNGWTTESFAEYVASKSQGYVPLCRDHGGPWQGLGEDDLSEEEAMARARTSFLHDIAAGFDLLHIDPSLRGGSLTDRKTISRICELYGFVCETAATLGADVEIEIGAEQQSGCYSDPEELVALLKAITGFCNMNSLKHPIFCVVQTGTLVKEMRNVGFTEGRKNEAYDQKFAVEHMEKRVRYLADIAYINGVYIKEHNGDYLSDGSMSLRRKLGVGGVNVAPELGVSESKRLLSLCFELGLPKEAESLLSLFYSSNKWEKWLSVESDATDIDKALMAGHYTFASSEFKQIKGRIDEAGKRAGVDVDAELRSSIKSFVQRMAWCLGYLHGKVASSEGVSRQVETFRGGSSDEQGIQLSGSGDGVLHGLWEERR